MLAVSALESVLLEGVSGELFGHSALPVVCPFTEVEEWDALLQMSCQHRVTTILWRAFSNAGWIPPPFTDTDDEHFLVNGMNADSRIKWLWTVEIISSGYSCHKRVLDDIRALLRDEGYEYCELKGVSLAEIYPSPTYRMFSDLDIFIPRGVDQVEKAIMNRWGGTIERGAGNHDKMMVRDVLVEIHRNFADQRKYLSNRIMERMLLELYGRDRDTFRLCFVFQHAAKHFASAELSLLNLLDVAMLMTRYHDTLDYSAIYELTSRCGSRRFYDVTVRFLEHYLGFNASYGGPEVGRVSSELLEKVYDALFHPRFRSRDRKVRGGFSLTRWYISNRWKHRLVYARDSFLGVFLRTVWYRLK